MLKSYRAWLVSLSLLLVFVLSGCSNTATIDAHSTGIWDHYFVYPISLMLQFVAHHVPNGSFGIAIIIITLVIRTAMIPLAVTQYRVQMRTKKMQPQLQKLKEKHGDVSKDIEKQKKYQKEMMELMNTSGANPMMGCLPLLIQMPIFSALYYAISRTEEIRTSSFLWVNLGHADPYHILPIIAALTTFIQMKIMQSNTAAGEQVQMLKIQQFMMPAMILFMGFAAPSGLVLYWITGNVFTMLQMIVLRKVMEREEGQLQKA
ncbi:membrane protein insertase YidC [Bacillus sp. DX1.1]|uniref:membrane protein insertase YidC n=1 Tax=unclassified Bacillus (in: firmicutes) TaxID=185979 RepID=UPI002570AB9C|nr:MULTISPECIES: membrane protein insertase YidC [unclassified Bacillus (in: firmicutes)]MDM5157143.1 membrane protein insertase YidC [Bacillus sp. DX1.1]WJE81377.1 membrane protein insertase YidC [Bacillus sp. DX3.1]